MKSYRNYKNLIHRKTTISSTLLIRYVLRVLLWIEHYHLCLEGPLKLRLRYLWSEFSTNLSSNFCPLDRVLRNWVSSSLMISITVWGSFFTWTIWPLNLAASNGSTKYETFDLNKRIKIIHIRWNWIEIQAVLSI